MSPSKKPNVFALAFLLFLALAPSLQVVIRAQTPSAEIKLGIYGLVQPSLNFTLDDLKSMPQAIVPATLYCVSAPSSPLIDGVWTGVTLSYLLQQTNIAPDALKVAFYATDGFSTDLPLQTVMQNSQILVAYQKDNQTLSALRLVVPGYWGYKWINDLAQIELVNYNFLGTQESNGYSDEGLAFATGSAPNFQTTQPLFNSTLTVNSTIPQQIALSNPTNQPPPPISKVAPTISVVDSNPKPQTAFVQLYPVAGLVAVTVLATGLAIALIKRKTRNKQL